ncbi:hypothetical protein [Blastomonas fulva]|uniref:hypothetical protein n=1 Tax=Blastomonas fulva TaxID=1550728 RepID=UPI003F6F7F3C
MTKKYQNAYVTKDQVSNYEMLSSLLKSMYNEFQELSKKKPQDVLTASKVKLVNRVLRPTLSLLEDEPTRPFLDLLDEDELPQNSDVILMLGQVRAAMDSFKSSYHDFGSGWHFDRSI